MTPDYLLEISLAGSINYPGAFILTFASSVFN